VSWRFETTYAALRRLLGDRCDSSEVTEAAELAATASAACVASGHPLGAAHAELAEPEKPHVRLRAE
jgi:hypothetical protein